MTIETNGPSSTSTAGGGLVNTATDTHTHSCATTSSSQTNEPPYIEVIYGQRKDPSPSASVGSEQAVTSGGDGTTYSYIYDGDGNMVLETIGLTTTLYIGNIYEKKDQNGTVTQKKVYYAGSLRVAVSTKVGTGSWDVNFLLSDHLGSSSLTVDTSGGRVSEMRYSPWGSVRYMDGNFPTDYTYTGQRSVTYINLIKMGVRWYDPALGRFTQPDSIVPGTPSLTIGVFDETSTEYFIVDNKVSINSLAFDRYSYSVNNPL